MPLFQNVLSIRRPRFRIKCTIVNFVEDLQINGMVVVKTISIQVLFIFPTKIPLSRSCSSRFFLGMFFVDKSIQAIGIRRMRSGGTIGNASNFGRLISLLDFSGTSGCRSRLKLNRTDWVPAKIVKTRISDRMKRLISQTRRT